MKGAIFLDKDGTLVDNSKYPEVIPSDEILENDVIEGLKYLQNKGYRLIIVSNQPSIAKGRLTKEEIENIFKSVVSKLNEKGVIIDDYFYCPHQSSDNCMCKKPKPSMILEAAKKHDIDLLSSYIIGDMDADVLAGKNAGVKSILVMTGNGKDFVGKVNADYVIKNLNEINKVI